MSVLAATPSGTRGAPRRIVGALTAIVAVSVLAATLSLGLMTGRSLSTTPLPGPTTGTLVPSQSPLVKLPSPRPLPSAPRP